MILSFLKIKEGKFVTVRRFHDGLKLCAVDYQNDNKAPSVHIFRRERDQKNQMALYFQHDNDYYLPRVDGNSLTLEKAAGENIPDNISDSHWFEKENLGCGEHYGLRSVVEPTQYLSTRFQRMQCIFFLSETPHDCVQVTDEEVE